MNKHSIDTLYDGILFRSRAEARWAVLFQALGMRFSWEHEAYHTPYGNYLPDFWLPEFKLWFEVKGEEPTYDELKKCEAVSEITGYSFAIAHGTPGDNPFRIFGGFNRFAMPVWIECCEFSVNYFDEKLCIHADYWGQPEPRFFHPNGENFRLFNADECACLLEDGARDINEAIQIARSYRFDKTSEGVRRTRPVCLAG